MSVSVSLSSALTPQNRLVRLLHSALAQSSTAEQERSESLSALREAFELASSLDPYVERCTSSLLIPATHAIDHDKVRAVWERLLLKTDETDWKALHEAKMTKYRLSKGMCTGEYEAVVLQHLVHERARPTRVLEIGLFTGTTTFALALLDNVTSVTALDIEPFLESFDRPYWKEAGVSDKIKTLFGSAADTLVALSKQSAARSLKFDVVYIDADKPNYKRYVELLLDLDLVSQDGTIYADNTLYKGFVVVGGSAGDGRQQINEALQSGPGSNNRSLDEATRGIAEFNEFVRNDERLTAVMLPVRDGLTMIKRVQPPRLPRLEQESEQ